MRPPVLPLCLLAIAVAAHAADLPQRPPASETAWASPAGRGGGLAIIIGDDPTPALGLAGSGRWLVQQLATSPGSAATARAALRKRGLIGLATVRVLARQRLPFADGIADLIVADAPVEPREIERVLAPRGLCWQRSPSGWSATLKPVPEGFDGWTHAEHGPGNNSVSRETWVGAPTGLRWISHMGAIVDTPGHGSGHPVRDENAFRVHGGRTCSLLRLEAPDPAKPEGKSRKYAGAITWDWTTPNSDAAKRPPGTVPPEVAGPVADQVRWSPADPAASPRRPSSTGTRSWSSGRRPGPGAAPAVRASPARR